ncbi:MAG: hypothetical protein B1H11_11995 [Desulfobacteraceae bacterium 4484_190.1]|nr:MAG: hypothetical protein B1H11_11995 [Desulfobacteraceae bacterium 4484_190.1]
MRYLYPNFNFHHRGMAGIICCGGVLFRSELGYDDALDVVGIHGFGGIWGPWPQAFLPALRSIRMLLTGSSSAIRACSGTSLFLLLQQWPMLL